MNAKIPRRPSAGMLIGALALSVGLAAMSPLAVRAQTADAPTPPGAPSAAPAPITAAPPTGRAEATDAADPASLRRRGMPIARPEDRLLPVECLYTNSTPHTLARPDLYGELLKRYGEGWSHMHHYCNALRLNLEYHRTVTSPTRRQAIANRMIGELDYVIRHSPPDFELLPMVLIRKIDYLSRLGRTRDALESTIELTERFPDLADGHARLAAMMRRAGRTADADAVIARARGLVASAAELEAAVQRYAALN